MAQTKAWWKSGVQKLLHRATSVRPHAQTWLTKTDLAKVGKKKTKARCQEIGCPYHRVNIIDLYKSLGGKGHLKAMAQPHAISRNICN